jgi:hypothetical protein
MTSLRRWPFYGPRGTAWSARHCPVAGSQRDDMLFGTSQCAAKERTAANVS